MKKNSRQIGEYSTNYLGEVVHRNKAASGKVISYVNKKFGRLLVIEELGMTPTRETTIFGCLCDCGNKFATKSSYLKSGTTKSCGCLHRESVKLKYPYAGKNALPYGHASRNELLSSYKKSARDREIVWGISDDAAFRLFAQPCSYCETPPDTFRKPNKQVNGGFWYSGIDRVDNSIGYVPTNVVSCCWNCNRAKGKLSYDEFIAWAIRLGAATAARSARFEFKVAA